MTAPDILAPSPDAALLDLHRQIREAETALAALADDYAPGCDERMERVLAPADAAYDQLETMQARTPAGLAAKADALRWVFERTVCTAPNFDGRTSIATIGEDGEWQDRLAWSLARDVIAWASKDPEGEGGGELARLRALRTREG